MRMSHLFAIMLAVAGVGAVAPASAATSTTKIAPATSVDTSVPATVANQYRRQWTNSGYRIRYGNRGYGNRGYGYRGNGYRRGYRGYRNPRYIAIPRIYSSPRYRGSRYSCNTTWRYGRARRVCFRRW